MADRPLLDQLDPQALEQETVEHLRALIRFETVNPPGNEDEAARWIEKVLRKEGYEPVYIESAPRRGNLIARYASGGGDRPLLLNAHLDVVPAGSRGWKHPPFSGEVHEGCVWGRGALDMKGMAAMCLTLMQTLARRRARLRRDIIFAATADEEAGGDFGAGYLVEKHPKLIEAEYALGEVGGFTLHVGKRRFYPIQVAERGLCWMKIRTRGEPGHGSMPHGNQAVAKLARVIDRLNRQRFPTHPVAVVRQFWAEVGRRHPFPLSLIFRLLAHPTVGPWLVRTVVPQPQRKSMFAVLSHTAAVTVLDAGVKTNVIPDEAAAEVDGRILPGFSVEQFLEEFRALIREDVEVELILADPGLVMSHDTPLFATLMETIRQHDAEGIPVPYMIPGMTDARHFSRLGTIMYGFSPLRLPADLPFNQLFHGYDERVPVEALGFGVRVLLDAVMRFAS